MSEDMKEKRAKALTLALGAIEKQFGKGSVVTGHAIPGIEFNSTGCPSLDKALGGGLPKGRMIEIYGPESSGKTTLVLHAIAECQKKGGTAAFIDVEHALDPAYATALGVDLDSLVLSQPDSGEQALEIVDTLVKSGAVDLIAVDSVAALVPQKELEGEMGDAVMGAQARLMSQAMRKLTGSCSKSGTTLIWINQIRMKIGVMFGNPETTTGGNALKFYASVRIDIRRSGVVKNGSGDEAEIVGSKTVAKVVKNKIAPPFKEADILYTAIAKGLIKKAGAWYSYDGENIGQGEDNTIVYLKNNPKVKNQILELLAG
jgi:recombination protein RecA